MEISIGSIFIKKFLKDIKRISKPEIAEDLKYVTLTAKVDDKGEFKIISMYAINSEKEREKIDMKKLKTKV